jgi:hypothetical protein
MNFMGFQKLLIVSEQAPVSGFIKDPMSRKLSLRYELYNHKKLFISIQTSLTMRQIIYNTLKYPSSRIRLPL